MGACRYQFLETYHPLKQEGPWERLGIALRVEPAPYVFFPGPFELSVIRMEKVLTS